MLQITVDHCTSFARSVDEELCVPEQFYSVTSQWLMENQPVLSSLAYQIGLKLSGDRRAAATAQTVVGYVLRLMDHAQANLALRDLVLDTDAPVGGSPARERAVELA